MANDFVTPRQQAILDSFDYHRPSPEQSARIEGNRYAFKQCALTVIANTPEGPDQTAALRQLHEAMMTANKGIACEPGTPHHSLPLPGLHPIAVADVLQRRNGTASPAAPGDEGCPGVVGGCCGGFTGGKPDADDPPNDRPLYSADDPNPGV